MSRCLLQSFASKLDRRPELERHRNSDRAGTEPRLAQRRLRHAVEDDRRTRPDRSVVRLGETQRDLTGRHDRIHLQPPILGAQQRDRVFIDLRLRKAVHVQ